MGTPLLSIIIPTCGRPQFLPQAINSALQGMDNDVEVIAVPNGPDESWRTSVQPFASDRRVRVEPITTAHANAARNHGKNLARGEYLRFLDDDDVLHDGASRLQCDLLESSGADICSGALEFTDVNEHVFDTRCQPLTEDFTSAILLPERLVGPCAHVFRSISIKHHWWDESISLGQDVYWMNQLCRDRDYSWVTTSQSVGIWRHHSGPRISAASRLPYHLKLTSGYLRETIEALRSSGRLTQERRAAAAKGMWDFVHRGFYLEPRYWSKILRETQAHFPGTYPDIGLYQFPGGRLIPPMAVESLMLPKRRLNHAIRKARYDRGGLLKGIPP